MTILEKASCHDSWQAFLTYKLERHHLNAGQERELRDFIERRAYLPLCQAWTRGEYPAQYPVKRIINKQGTKKKRIVYSFTGDEGIFLKFTAFQLFDFDDYFCDNCYAFRRGFGAGDAIRRIRQQAGLSGMYCLKVDISNYFNSICVEKLLEKLTFVRDRDVKAYELFERILSREQVWENGRLVPDRHGAMAGTPVSPFFANVYLRDMDAFFQNLGILYFRYSDDILIFADTEALLMQYREQLYRMLDEHLLLVNPEKVHISRPGETWEFLGFGYRNGAIGLSEMTVRKIKAKIRRKAKTLRRWQRKKGLSGDKAAIGLIRAMNQKFYGARKPHEELEEDNAFTWSRWFFPNLTVDTDLKEIDACLRQYIRYAVTGRHYKGNYRISYEQLKAWGLRSLVHEFYKERNLKRGAPWQEPADFKACPSEY